MPEDTHDNKDICTRSCRTLRDMLEFNIVSHQTTGAKRVISKSQQLVFEVE